jgi:D-tyrosyl-tRNA(Tyr) deacylase
MKAVIQRVKSAVCVVGGEETGGIGPGLLVFLGVARSDTDKEAEYMVHRLVNMRIFPDENDKMNLSVKDKNHAMLVISQFTLLADTHKGHRPNFMNAASPADAERLYEVFMTRAAEHVTVARGRFGAMMDITAVNDGPVTIIVESK